MYFMKILYPFGSWLLHSIHKDRNEMKDPFMCAILLHYNILVIYSYMKIFSQYI